MSNMNLIVPVSIRKQIVDAAARDSISVDRFVATALAEKLSALMTEGYLKERASHGDRKKFDAVLAKVPAAEPEPEDRLP